MTVITAEIGDFFAGKEATFVDNVKRHWRDLSTAGKAKVVVIVAVVLVIASKLLF